MFLKRIALCISGPLSVLYQKSLDTMNCPNEWLKALIIAIFKTGVKCLAENYRPISQTSILCKSMESPITEHIKNHMVTNGFFSTFQYGFIPGRSAPLQLLTVLETWQESIENGYDIDCIYVDFMKAFDPVPHKRLIVKMKCYGIVDPILGWVESFLSNRTQYVSVNGKCSELKAVT